MEKLLITSCLAANTFPATGTVADYISRRLHLAVEFVNDISWEEREQRLDAGQIHLGWVCGLLYVWQKEKSHLNLELLAAPVMCGRRYQDQPVYFSDVVVRKDSPFNTFDDLRGAAWVYNERRSYSGYYIVCHHLAGLAKSVDYFGRSLESGAHVNSLQIVIDGQADVTAIDSTVLDNAILQQPSLVGQIRVIEALGPSPIPPWVVSRQLPVKLRQELRRLLLEMDAQPSGRASLSGGQLSRFAPIDDRDYDQIRDVRRTVNRHTIS